jgi:hypothetical protein
MNKVDILIAIGAAALLSGTASAGKKPEAPDQVVCKTEGDSGSRINNKRVCRTRSEWRMEEEERLRDAERGIENTYRRTLKAPARRGL